MRTPNEAASVTAHRCGRRKADVQLRPNGADDLHWRNASIGNHFGPCLAGRPSGYPLRWRDTCLTTPFTNASPVGQVSKRKNATRRGWCHRRGNSLANIRKFSSYLHGNFLLSKQVLNSAIAAFIVEIVAKHGEPAKRLCNKDPFTMKSAVYLSELFPRAKFLLMVRDGRATVHSIITRKVTITGFDLTSYRDCLTKWNKAVTIMHNECQSVGPSRCLMVHYEQLVLHPQVWMEKILNFLDVPWDDVVLHHEQLINRPGGISLSK